MRNIICLCSLLLILFTSSSLAQSAPTSQYSERLLSPPVSDGPVNVQISFHLQDINNIDDEQEQFEFVGTLTLTWKDSRQAFDPAVAGISEKFYQGEFQFHEVAPAWYPQVVLTNESGLLERRGITLRVKPDGTSTLIETVNATVECDLNMRLYPFDKHKLIALFRVHGTSTDQVRLIVDPHNRVSTASDLSVSQWQLGDVDLVLGDQKAPYLGSDKSVAMASLVIPAKRQALFALRLVALPLVIIVVLSWSIFWMERSSLGDRINVSFIGILTAVAYQIVVGDLIPRISYITLINAFLNTSLIIMSASAIMNLVVGECDKRGKSELGDLVDFRCRRIFPLVYLGLILGEAAFFFTFFPN